MIIENKKRIIASAIEIFMKKGIVATTMTDVAKAVNYDRRTLYRYFSNKDELVLEVVVNILKDWNAYQKQVFDRLTGSGLIKFRNFYRELLKKEDRMELIELVTEFDMVFDLHDFVLRTDRSDLVNKYQEQAVYPHALLKKILDEGVSDGSIKSINVEEAIPVFHNVLWSIMQKSSISSRSINDVLDIDFIDITNKQIDMYVEYLRG